MTTEVDEALAAAAEAFKRTAQAEIDGLKREMRNVLTVTYKDAPKAALPDGIKAPRLQLRWAADYRYSYEYTCYYEMVFPIREHDCRNDYKQNFGVVELSRTSVGGEKDPSQRGSDPWDNTPFRDGCHIQWDSEVFGDLPMYVIAIDGTATLLPKREKRAA